MLKFLSSIQLAIFLIAAIAGMSVVATMVGNDSVYTSIPFLALVAVFALNLTLCTIKMLPKLKATWMRRAADLGTDGAGYSVYRTADGKPALAAVEELLQKERYHVDQVSEAGVTKVLATKGKASLPAPHLLHIAILVVMAGAVMTAFSVTGGVFAYVGQSSPMTTVVRQHIGDGSAAKNAPGEIGDDYIQVLDFQTVYDEQGAVDNWVTHFNMVIDGEQVVTDGVTKVNYPYKYKNMLIYQNSYGNQYLIDLKGTEDADTYSVPSGNHFPLAGTDQEFMVMDLGDGRTLLKVFQLEESGEETVVLGQVIVPGDIVEINPGVTIEYLAPNPYTVLEVKISYGTPVVFFGFILAALASMLFWVGRYREIRIISEEGSETIKVLAVCKNKMIVQQIDSELQKLLVKEAA